METFFLDMDLKKKKAVMPKFQHQYTANIINLKLCESGNLRGAASFIYKIQILIELVNNIKETNVIKILEPSNN